MPTGKFGRSYTSYEGYKDYSSEDMMNAPLDGVHTPQPFDGRYTPLICPEGNGRISPAAGKPVSKLRSPSRAQSRLEVGIQTETRPKPAVFETQYNYAIPDQIARPTSPVQRLLDRSLTQPHMNLQKPLPGTEMDPFTKQYYHRMWQSQTPTQNISLNRYGRAGGVWRHVRACVANTGTQLAFIDGTVKEEDNVFFPQWPKYSSNPRQGSFINYPTCITATYSSPQPVMQTVNQKYRPSNSYRNKFNMHAKEGFKYWYQEPKPINLKGSTTRLHARIVGNCF